MCVTSLSSRVSSRLGGVFYFEGTTSRKYTAPLYVAVYVGDALTDGAAIRWSCQGEEAAFLMVAARVWLGPEKPCYIYIMPVYCLWAPASVRLVLTVKLLCIS